MLEFLFTRHIDNPGVGPTQAEIFAHVWRTESIGPNEGGDVARKEVGRLRDLLRKYSKAEGTQQTLILTIPQVTNRGDGYKLVFERPADRADIARQWFWGAYLEEVEEDEIERFFGIIPDAASTFASLFLGVPVNNPAEAPEELRVGQPYALLRTYRYFSRFLAPVDLKIVPAGWEKDFSINEGHNIFLAKDINIALPRRHRKPTEADPVHDLAILMDQGFTLSMVRSNLKTMVIKEGSLTTTFVDSKNKKHVLLIRLTTHEDREQTLLVSNVDGAIVKVSEFITSRQGLQLIEALPEMRKATQALQKPWKGFDPGKEEPRSPQKYRDGAPRSFQILFSVLMRH